MNDTSDMNKFLAMEEAKTLPRDLKLLWGASPVALESEGAKEFVDKTHVDALAIAVGTAHIVVAGGKAIGVRMMLLPLLH